MYQAYPGGSEQPGPSQLTTAPPSVMRAVQLMYAGAVASLIGIVIDLTTVGSLKSAIEAHDRTLTAAKVNTLEHAEIALLIISGVIAAGLWIWMALSCKAGKGWARIVSTVLFAVDTVGLLIGIGGAAPGGHATRFYAIVVWVIGLAAIILLYRRSSSNYFNSAPRY
jgi:hypothetical protein